MSTPNPAEDLAQVLDDVADEMIPEPPTENAPTDERERAERFRIDTETQLSWATRKYANAERLIDEARSAAKSQVDRIRAWESRVVAEQEGRMRYFEGLCADYLKRRQKEDKKLKGIPTPYARVQSRKQPTAWNIADPNAVLTAIKTYVTSELAEELIRVTTVPALSAIKEAAKAGSVMQLVTFGRDLLTENVIYQVQIRTTNEDGEVVWVDLPGITVAEQPDKVSIEVSK